MADSSPPEVTAFSWVPPMPRGLVRDIRVRWALEEVDRDYRTRLFDRRVSGPEDRKPEQPFGQVPAYREGNVALFESGAICLWIAEKHPGLLPEDENARASALSWTFAALNSVEPNILLLQYVTLFDADKPGAAEFVPTAQSRLADRLQQLSDALGERDWLAGEFSVADILMVSVLRQLGRGDRLDPFPNLVAYVARGEARAAFKRAYDAHMADFMADAET
ncbi:MAG: glutathione S-transferase family protein [Novosphingobium sp.]|nr:glutathione S-transferase family protein [Novosphingobium sp.]